MNAIWKGRQVPFTGGFALRNDAVLDAHSFHIDRFTGGRAERPTECRQGLTRQICLQQILLNHTLAF
jgi:hypothetical protein